MISSWEPGLRSNAGICVKKRFIVRKCDNYFRILRHKIVIPQKRNHTLIIWKMSQYIYIKDMESYNCQWPSG